jgi:hypothetical protein
MSWKAIGFVFGGVVALWAIGGFGAWWWFGFKQTESGPWADTFGAVTSFSPDWRSLAWSSRSTCSIKRW